MDAALFGQVIEVRLDEEDRLMATVSGATLDYMYRWGLARECRLRSHRGNLGFDADQERDLFEAMRLAERLSKVDKNIRGTTRRNERLRSEILRREADGRAAWVESGRRRTLPIGGKGWSEESLVESDSLGGGGRA